MIVSVHQPHYLPWSGYFDKIDTADVFVLLDTVQYEKNGWQNRNRIRTADGWTWLTVPVKREFGAAIADTGIADDHRWRHRHLQALTTNYSGTPGFEPHLPFYRDCYSRKWDNLAALNREMLDYFMQALGIETEIVTASSLGALPDEPNIRLASIVSRLGGDIYLAGSGCGDYFQEEPFTAASIRVVFQDYHEQPYRQRFEGYVPGMSVVDVMCNRGDDALETIRAGRRTLL